MKHLLVFMRSQIKRVFYTSLFYVFFLILHNNQNNPLNQNPEQLACDHIDQQLRAVGRVIQSKSQINLRAARGVAVRQYQTGIGPADCVLFSYRRPATATEIVKRPMVGEDSNHKKICCCIFGNQLQFSILNTRT